MTYSYKDIISSFTNKQIIYYLPCLNFRNWFTSTIAVTIVAVKSATGILTHTPNVPQKGGRIRFAYCLCRLPDCRFPDGCHQLFPLYRHVEEGDFPLLDPSDALPDPRFVDPALIAGHVWCMAEYADLRLYGVYGDFYTVA